MWSQEKLAEMSGLSRGYVQRAESSNAEISLAAFHAIAQAFGMKGSDLLREVEDAAPPPKPVTSTKSKKGSR
jgi:transcriptional regulator with XRE-family HTH domain